MAVISVQVFPSHSTAAQPKRWCMISAFSINDIIYGVENKEFLLRYRPQVNAASGQLHALDTKLLWHSSKFGSQHGEQFLPALEEGGKHLNFLLFYLIRSLRARQQLRNAGYSLPLAISLRLHDLQDPALVDALMRVFRDSGDNPDGLTLILPSRLLDDFYQHIKPLSQLIDNGFHLAVSNFYQSPDSLGDTCCDMLSEIRLPPRLGTSLTDRDVRQRHLSQALEAAQHHHWDCVVTGVENRRDIQEALAMGASLVQGYGVGDDLSASELATMLARVKQPRQMPRR